MYFCEARHRIPCKTPASRRILFPADPNITVEGAWDDTFLCSWHTRRFLKARPKSTPLTIQSLLFGVEYGKHHRKVEVHRNGGVKEDYS